MKKSFLFLFIFIHFVLFSQNLVPNPSFEDNKTCEFIIGAFDTSFTNSSVVNKWASGNFSGTPDYFNSCQVFNNNWHYSTPLNYCGIQKPINGRAYAGIIIQSYYNSNLEFKEYLQTKINKTLTKGVNYCVGFYCSLAESDSAKIKSGNSLVSIKNWGLLLSNTRVFNPINGDALGAPVDAFILSANPQIKATEFIKDTTNWVLVSGIYTANGGEEWLTIGNFNPYGQTPVDTIYQGVYNIISYYYIDNVFVIPMNAGGLLPTDTSICAADYPITVNAYQGFINYLWEQGDTTRNILVTEPGFYSIKANYEGCELTDTIQVSTKSIPIIDLQDIHVCENALPIVVSIPDSLSFDAYNWSNGSTNRSTSIVEVGNISVVASGACGEASDDFNVTSDEIPIVNLGEDRSLCQNGINETILLTNQSILPNYLWSNGATNIAIEVANIGVYSLSTTNACGTYQDEIEISGCPANIYVPNIFNPTSGSIENTIFREFASNATILSLDIFDRWGEHIFSQEGTGAGWDGTWKGKECTEGVYIYILRYKSNENEQIYSINGNVTLVR
jgi:gliding motility-associated-like protein